MTDELRMDILTEERRARVKARLLSYRGHALVTALSVAAIMAAILIMAMKTGASDAVERIPLKLDEPGPPPITITTQSPAANLSKGAAAAAPPVKMKPIGCPDDWERPGVTCWQAQ